MGIELLTKYIYNVSEGLFWKFHAIPFAREILAAEKRTLGIGFRLVFQLKRSADVNERRYDTENPRNNGKTDTKRSFFCGQNFSSTRTVGNRTATSPKAAHLSDIKANHLTEKHMACLQTRLSA